MKRTKTIVSAWGSWSHGAAIQTFHTAHTRVTDKEFKIDPTLLGVGFFLRHTPSSQIVLRFGMKNLCRLK